MSVNGIDVASYQNTAYTTAGLGFVIVKATEGTGYVNPKHAAQIATGRTHGLVVGHYHFARAGSVGDQVAYFLRNAAPQAGDLLALDWEDTGMSAADKDAWIKQAQAAAPGHRVLLYCNRDFWLNRDRTDFCGDGLWIADPSAPAGRPRVQHAWTIHQYSETGGIDHDVASFADKAALQAWARKAVPAPAYEPFPGAGWFTTGRRSPIVAAMHDRLVAVGCDHYASSADKDVIGSGDVASYEAWQRKYSTDHDKGWTGAALKWPPGKESWDALKVPNV
ncbi:Lyzozyme M1 (1,4-beta-N-acetylmuramidase), GH25 family [Streptomyces sp. DvalAA-14]|uniref:GH25 family lysozyme n=1 Tax=unclassified Streptomyces TaxID=2593676 RepID=UPI00081B8497|nr:MULTISPECIES: GH25 family lysozyme [unclassified Streptomyces]MYS23187.1 hydrolase [Streptomyces sp. SID4948]SCE28997.1 Lyzozyme M1 (1,4-beta-N-acetylmuramidase), GH25 family [Streptomyces sp. DvalAA-14]